MCMNSWNSSNTWNYKQNFGCVYVHLEISITSVEFSEVSKKHSEILTKQWKLKIDVVFLEEIMRGSQDVRERWSHVCRTICFLGLPWSKWNTNTNLKVMFCPPNLKHLSVSRFELKRNVVPRKEEAKGKIVHKLIPIHNKLTPSISNYEKQNWDFRNEKRKIISTL